MFEQVATVASFDSGIAVMDWLGIVAFTITGALAASRNQMDVVGFVLLGTLTGIGGGTLRDLLLNIHPILWIEQPAYLAVCIGFSVVVFFTAHLAHSRYRLILWFDAIGLALFATVGAERAIGVSSAPIVAVVMGVITASFGGIIRDILSQQRSIIFARELYVTAAMAAAVAYTFLHELGAPREVAVVSGILTGFALRAGALRWGWSLPRYHPRPPRSSWEDRTEV
jgi:uncharacterized membrane protein YeiH